MAKHLADLDQHARELASIAVDWMDAFWDAEVELLWMPDPTPSYTDSIPHVQHHIVRETAWYALGLLLRDGAHDRERACVAIAAILRYQFDAPERVFHGTWYRTPEEAYPPDAPVEWQDYDPNWREFIGTTLAVILIEYEDRLPASLVAAIDSALQRAVVGTLARRVPASYTNIALMSAWLLCYAAERFHEPSWATLGEQLATDIHDLFAAHNTFEEYNSPTYYGVDLYALALWRSYASSPRLRQLGTKMEQALWRDIAQLYHAGMRNLSGPFDRSYGMDLRQYANLIGMWIAVAAGSERAPLPDWRQPMDHAHDFCYVPCFALLGAQMPADVLPHFSAFRGKRQVERTISTAPQRVATAWIGADVMLGGEDSGGTKPPSSQFHPATIYWQRGDDLGWIRVLHTMPLDAHATEDRLTLVCHASEQAEAEVVFRVFPAGDANTIHADVWLLPGLTIHVETNARGPRVTHTEAGMEIRYTPATPGDAMRFALITTLPGDTP